MSLSPSKFIKIAIEIAKSASSNKHIPVAGVLAIEDTIVATAYNDYSKTSINHAEIALIFAGSQITNKIYLEECSIYLTMQPCPMCMFALFHARIKSIYFACYNYRYQNIYSKIRDNINNARYNEFLSKCFGGYCDDISQEIIQDFFQSKR